MEKDDGDEMEVTWEELQKEIREEVENNEMMVLKRTQLAQLQTLIEKREKQAIAIRKLSTNTCKSVVECEAVMKELYSQLGIEYKDTDSEDEEVGGQNAIHDNDGAVANNRDDAMDCDDIPQSSYAVNTPESDAPSPQTTDGPTAQSEERPQTSKTQDTDSLREEAYIALAKKERLVVVLTKLPEYKIRIALHPPKPQDYSSEEEDLISNDSDAQWEPPGGSSDSDHSYSSSESRKKSEKQKTGKLNKEDVGKTPAPQAHTDTTINATHKATTPQANANTDATNKATTAQTNTKTQKPNKVSCVPVVCSVSQAPPNPATQAPADLTEEAIKEDMVVLARRRIKTWQQGKVVEIVTKDNGEKYKVDFGEKGRCLLSGHHIAFDHTASLERLYVGARVVATYQEAEQSWFYSGVLAELPSRKNRMRFLVFFDDHTPSYVGLPLLHLVCRPLKDVWEDIEDAIHSSFIKEYLKVWPNPPQAQYRVGQNLNVEFQGVQRRCEVEQVDGSLIHVVFQDDQHREWVYRGSMRLEHMANMKKRFEDMETQRSMSKPAPKPSAGSTQTVHSSKSAQTGSTLTTKPARSNFTNPNPIKKTLISSSNEKTNAIPPYTVVTYTPHRCSPVCLDRSGPIGSMSQHRGRNPLLVPLLYGFRRIKAPKRGKSKGSTDSTHVFYRSPCGLCLCKMANVQDYLYQTRCDFLYLEMFCLDVDVAITTTYEALPSKIYIPDISQGKDTQLVSCINEYNNIRPPTVTYSRDRVVTRAVSINTSLNFMVGCDCADGCKDSVACSCHQLTIQATALCPGGPVDASAGYSYKRLNNSIVTGVYECNAQCRCDPRVCSNRLVQNGLQLRLQIFMTLGKGWGVRCLDDVAKGSFVCTFSGRIQHCETKHTDSNAFYAKLNHIEGVEIHKPDYETDAYCSDSEAEPIDGDNNGHGDNGSYNEDVEGLSDEDEESDDASDRDFYKCKRSFSILEKNYITRRNARILQEDPGKTAGSEGESTDPPAREKRSEVSTTTRSFFDEEKECYIIDAKMEGNLARYLNHSCNPNLFEQNVFVDTHDLRFPWLAFFTRKRIKAGTELTWDYRSFIGSAEGISRGLHCRCGSNNCLGKL